MSINIVKGVDTGLFLLFEFLFKFYYAEISNSATNFTLWLQAPSSLLDALEQHLAALEGKKSVVNAPVQIAT